MNDTVDMVARLAGLIDTKLPGLLHPAYGYVLIIVFATYILGFIQGNIVGKMRTKYKVELPAMYSDTEPMFNCYQRVHQNTLERIPIFLAMLLIAGLFNSIVAAILGAVWVVGRIIYSIGYYSGVPKNRIAGGAVRSHVCYVH